MGNSNRIIITYSPENTNDNINLEDFIKYVNERVRSWQDKNILFIRIHLNHANKTIYDPLTKCQYEHTSIPLLVKKAFNTSVTVVNVKRCSIPHHTYHTYHIDLQISPKLEETL